MLRNKNNRVIGVAFDNKRIVIIRPEVASGRHQTYGINGTYMDITEEQRIEMVKLKTEYILIKAGDKDKRDLKDIYDERILHADELFSRTKGRINLYRTGRDTMTALDSVDYFVQTHNLECKKGTTRSHGKLIPEPDKIQYNEFLWLEDGSFGAMSGVDRSIMKNREEGDNCVYRGDGFTYDFCSFYGSVLASVNFNFPIKSPEFIKMTEEEFRDRINGTKKNMFLQYGIYHVRISYESTVPNTEARTDKDFHLNSLNKYTHTEIMHAHGLNMKIELIQTTKGRQINCEDGRPVQYNAMVYTGAGMFAKGADMFHDHINMWFNLRIEYENHPDERLRTIADRCKLILSSTWGVVCQRNGHVVVRDLDEDYDLFENRIVHSKTIMSNNRYKLEIVNSENPYATRYARLKPFLLAACRVKMSKLMGSHRNNIVRWHTDGFISNVKLDYNDEKKIGKIRFVKQNYVVVHSLKTIDYYDFGSVKKVAFQSDEEGISEGSPSEDEEYGWE